MCRKLQPQEALVVSCRCARVVIEFVKRQFKTQRTGQTGLRENRQERSAFVDLRCFRPVRTIKGHLGPLGPAYGDVKVGQRIGALAVPAAWSGVVRRILIAHAPGPIDLAVPVRASGYLYLGWVFAGRWQGFASDREIYDSSRDGALACAGQITRPDVTLRMTGPTGLINLELVATGAYRLFGIDVSTLNDRTVSLAALGGPVAPPAPMSGSDVLSALAPVIDPLVAAARPDLPGVADAVAAIESAAGNVAFTSLATQSPVSERTLRRNINRSIGLSPKRFARHVQVNAVLGELLALSPDDLAGLAQTYGFADQSHMTRAVIAFLCTSTKSARGGLEPALARFVGHSQQVPAFQ